MSRFGVLVPAVISAAALAACAPRHVPEQAHTSRLPFPYRSREVVGWVVDEATGRCVRGVSISIAGSPAGTLSDSSGWYAIRHVPDGELHLTARMIGLVPEERLLPMVVRYGTLVQYPGLTLPTTRRDTVNFYMRFPPLYLGPNPEVQRSRPDLVECQRGQLPRG